MHERVSKIVDDISEAAARSGRDRTAVQLVAVSKHHPVSAMQEYIRVATALGVDIVFGENYVQECSAKRAALAPEIPIHLIGPLQSNKARDAVQLFQMVQSAHSPKVVRALNSEAQRRTAILDILLQINISSDDAKSGFQPTELVTDEFVELVKNCMSVRIAGLMTITKFYDDPGRARPDFRALRELSNELRAHSPLKDRLGTELSMGMSADFAVAVEEGATIVRVGTAIFGER